MAGWNDSTEVLIGSGGGQVYFAPVGTVLPALNSAPTAALNAAFVGAGYLTEDGVGLSVDSTTVDVKAWQQRVAVRREKTGQDIQAKFTFLQWNETNLVFAFGGGAVVDNGGGKWVYQFPDETAALDERSLVIDATDGAKHYRYVFPRGNVTDKVDTSVQRTGPALLPVTFDILAPLDGSGSPGYILTDDPAFATGS